MTENEGDIVLGWLEDTGQELSRLGCCLLFLSHIPGHLQVTSPTVCSAYDHLPQALLSSPRLSSLEHFLFFAICREG